MLSACKLTIYSSFWYILYVHTNRMEKEPQTGTGVQRATLRVLREGLAGSPTVRSTIRLTVASKSRDIRFRQRNITQYLMQCRHFLISSLGLKNTKRNVFRIVDLTEFHESIDYFLCGMTCDDFWRLVLKKYTGWPNL